MILIILIDKTCSVHISISWLTKVLVSNHLILKTNEHLFHIVVSLPVGEDVELRWFNSAVLLVNAGKVDL